MRERSGRQDVPERSGPSGLARRASEGNATNESGGEAEIAGEVGMRRGAATRSLRSARGAAHSGVGAIVRLSGVQLEGTHRKILVENKATGGCGIMLRRV